MKLEEFENVEVGMWVRGKGRVCKVAKVGSDWIHTNKKVFTMNYDGRYDYDFMSLGFENIESSSHNIVDVLEVGDYANGYPIVKVGDGYVMYSRENHKGYKRGGAISYIDNTEIKSVLTKEQYEQHATKVVE